MTTGRDTATHSILQWEHDTRQIFTHTAFSAFCRQFTETWHRWRNDCLWKLRTVSDTMNKAYTKFYSPLEHLAVDKVNVKFNGRVIFRQYSPKKTFQHQILQILWWIRVYISHWACYLGKDSNSTTDDMTATQATVRHLTCKIEGLGHKIFMDNFFSSRRLSDDLESRKINSCRTVQSTKKTTETEKGWHKGEDQGGFDRINLEGQKRSLHAD